MRSTILFLFFVVLFLLGFVSFITASEHLTTVNSVVVKEAMYKPVMSPSF